MFSRSTALVHGIFLLLASPRLLSHDCRKEKNQVGLYSPNALTDKLVLTLLPSLFFNKDNQL